MSDTEFAALCDEHPDLFFEMSAEGELIVLPAVPSMMGARNSEIAGQLGMWARADRSGIATGSCAGFVLPNGARRSPNAAWTPKAAVRQLSVASREGFWHLCPAFVIELRSQTDRLPTLRKKMREYLSNGAELGWLIDPGARSVEVYRAGREPEVLTGVDEISGEGPVAGFRLDLRSVWDPLGL
jgi:Uma2 family endonuclease